RGSRSPPAKATCAPNRSSACDPRSRTLRPPRSAGLAPPRIPARPPRGAARARSLGRRGRRIGGSVPPRLPRPAPPRPRRVLRRSLPLSRGAGGTRLRRNLRPAAALLLDMEDLGGAAARVLPLCTPRLPPPPALVWAGGRPDPRRHRTRRLGRHLRSRGGAGAAAR